MRLTRLADVVALEVSDDGVGFERNRPGTPGGLGLITMRERASQLNGKFEFDSTPGRGTTIKVVIPFSLSRRQPVAATGTSSLARRCTASHAPSAADG